MDELRDCVVVEFTNGIKFYIGFDSNNKRKDIGKYDLCTYLGEVGIYDKLKGQLKDKNSTLGSLCVTAVESSGISFAEGGNGPIRNRDILLMKREQDTKNGMGFRTGISFKYVKLEHMWDYRFTSCVVSDALDSFKLARVYDSDGKMIDILEDICIQSMLGSGLVGKSKRLNKVEFSYASGAGTLSLAVKCAKESVQ